MGPSTGTVWERSEAEAGHKAALWRSDTDLDVSKFQRERERDDERFPFTINTDDCRAAGRARRRPQPGGDRPPPAGRGAALWS